MTESPVMDFDVLFYDHLIKEEPKLVNKVFSAQRRHELENRRVCLCNSSLILINNKILPLVLLDSY